MTQCSNFISFHQRSGTVRPANCQLGCTFCLFSSCLWPSFINGLFFAAFKPSNSAKVPWSKLFVLVLHDGLKYLQLRSISLSSCHSLPIFDNFVWKLNYIFFKCRRNQTKQRLSRVFCHTFWKVRWRHEQFHQEECIFETRNTWNCFMVILFVILCKINDDLLLIFLFFAHPQMQINYFFYNFAGPSPVDKLVFTFVHTILESSDGIFWVSK